MLKNKWFQFSLALFVIPFALNLVFYSQLPDVVPTHFDVNGQVLVGWAQQVVGDAADLQDHRLSCDLNRFGVIVDPRQWGRRSNSYVLS